VKECVVLARASRGADSQIIAYVVPRDGQQVASPELHAFVRRTLPDYMVPSAFVRLDALPLTSNHKLDVNALPIPDRVESSSSRPFALPANDIERTIAAEWERLLSVDRVGRDDDFFELGGHSILATSLARWMREHFQVDFPLTAIFQSPTVGGTAERVATLLAERADSRPMANASAEREEFDL
jgi:acyl carrier protein